MQLIFMKAWLCTTRDNVHLVDLKTRRSFSDLRTVKPKDVV